MIMYAIASLTELKMMTESLMSSKKCGFKILLLHRPSLVKANQHRNNSQKICRGQSGPLEE